MADYNYNGATLSKNRKLKDSEGKQTVETYCVMFGMRIQNTFHCSMKYVKKTISLGNPCSFLFNSGHVGFHHLKKFRRDLLLTDGEV